MESSQIRQRCDIPQEDKWALEDLFPTDEAWERELAALEEDKAYLQAFDGRLAASAQDLLAYLTRMEQVDDRTDRLANYCMRKADEDTRDPVYQAMSGRFITAAVELGAACSFETPQIMAISDETLEEFYARCPGLERFRRYLTDLRRRRDHTLSAAEEKLLAAAGELSQGPDAIFTAFSNADMVFPDAVDAAGNRHPLTQGGFVRLQERPDRVLRKSAYENLYTRYAQSRNTAAAILNAQNKQLKFFSDARRYPSPLEAVLDATNVPTAVYHNLIDTVHANLDKLHRYVRLRKRLLGVEELHFYDIYTPLIPEVDRHIPFAQAKQTVYDGLAALGEEYRAVLKEGFENRWIDVYQNPGKRSGAYSAGASVHPFVLLNYTGTLDSQFTLAHEMGHALHSYFSYKNRNPIDANYVIFVAEVASTCNEALLMEHLLAKTTDKRERAYLINHFLDQFKGTVYRQTMFAEFEREIGSRVAQGQTLTADLLSQLYGQLNRRYYGPDMVVDEHIAMEWARIPHFYYNYYVFQYATGYSAAMALSRRILSEGAPAVKDYLRFLGSGRTKPPIELLKDAGVDMTTPAPVEQALSMFGDLLDELDVLTRG